MILVSSIFYLDSLFCQQYIVNRIFKESLKWSQPVQAAEGAERLMKCSIQEGIAGGEDSYRRLPDSWWTRHLRCAGKLYTNMKTKITTLQTLVNGVTCHRRYRKSRRKVWSICQNMSGISSITQTDWVAHQINSTREYGTSKCIKNISKASQ